MVRQFLLRLLPTLLLIAICSQTVFAQVSAVTLQQGNRIVFIGDTFADRLRADGYVEAQLAARRPDLKLVCQTLGWSGDTLTLQPRPLNFGSQDEHLKRQAADVILLCYGMSDSLNKPKAADTFGIEMTSLIRHLRQQKFNGKSAPQLVIVSPIAHEQIDSRLGNAQAHNVALKEYVAVLQQISQKEKVPLVNLFQLISRLTNKTTSQKLTTNGIHLTPYGYWAVSHLITDALVGNNRERQLTIDVTKKKRTASGFTFQIQQNRLPLPLPPKGSVIHPKLEKRLNLVTFTNLKPGTYVLKVDGKTMFQGDYQLFADGIQIPNRPAQQLMRELQATIQRKDKWFFARYRPPNTEYIFGRRTQPYGVKSFPPEMKKMDELISEQHDKIKTDANQTHTENWELIRIEK